MNNLKGHFYFVPIYFNSETHEIKGRGLISGLLLSIMLGIHQFLIFVMSHFIELDWNFPISLNTYLLSEKEIEELTRID